MHSRSLSVSCLAGRKRAALAITLAAARAGKRLPTALSAQTIGRLIAVSSTAAERFAALPSLVDSSNCWLNSPRLGGQTLHLGNRNGLLIIHGRRPTNRNSLKYLAIMRRGKAFRKIITIMASLACWLRRSILLRFRPRPNTTFDQCESLKQNFFGGILCNVLLSACRA